MGMLSLRNPPSLPIAPEAYEREHFESLNNTLRLFFNSLNAVQVLTVAGLHIDLKTLPTDAALATLRVGDVYRDTTAGNALKVKV